MYPYKLTIPESFHPSRTNTTRLLRRPSSRFTLATLRKVPHTITIVRPPRYFSFSAYTLLVPSFLSLSLPRCFLLPLSFSTFEHSHAVSSIIPIPVPIFNARFLPLPRNTSARVAGPRRGEAGKERRMSPRLRRRSISTRYRD